MPGSGYRTYGFDLDGSVLHRYKQFESNPTQNNSVYDAFGVLRGDWDHNAAIWNPNPDAVGFKGQWGWYHDNATRANPQATGLARAIGERYYEAYATRILTRGSSGTNEYSAEQARIDEVIGGIHRGLGLTDPVLGGLSSMFLDSVFYAVEGKPDHAFASMSQGMNTFGYNALAASIGSAAPAAIAQARALGRRLLKLDKLSGTYKLVPFGTQNVVRTGRSYDLATRRATHGRMYPDLDFLVDKYTRDYFAMRGREQIISDLYMPILNKRNPIDPRNPLRRLFMRAGRRL